MCKSTTPPPPPPPNLTRRIEFQLQIARSSQPFLSLLVQQLKLSIHPQTNLKLAGLFARPLVQAHLSLFYLRLNPAFSTAFSSTPSDRSLQTNWCLTELREAPFIVHLGSLQDPLPRRHRHSLTGLAGSHFSNSPFHHPPSLSPCTGPLERPACLSLSLSHGPN